MSLRLSSREHPDAAKVSEILLKTTESSNGRPSTLRDNSTHISHSPKGGPLPMKPKYLRISAFYSVLRPYQEWNRRRRMQFYTAAMGVKKDMSILDLGGLPKIWDSVSQPLNLTILNLPGAVESKISSHHKIRYVEGDACQVREFGERSF